MPLSCLFSVNLTMSESTFREEGSWYLSHDKPQLTYPFMNHEKTKSEKVILEFEILNIFVSASGSRGNQMPITYWKVVIWNSTVDY